jgi:ADP-ribosylglycohydrolase
MYACLAYPEDFDSAIIAAVNHSGHSAATGAVAGAILGAHLGHSYLPQFYLESLEVVDSLMVLADDLVSATPASGLFDDDWDQKYVQGEPL